MHKLIQFSHFHHLSNSAPFSLTNLQVDILSKKMATPQLHIRSISLPTDLHPTNFESELQNFKSLYTSSVPITSSEAIQSSLLGLAELYNSVEEQFTRSSSHHQDSKSIEDSLEGSIVLLDSCSSIKELLQMIKENVQTLQSAFRRKGLDSSIQSDVATYVCFRKKMNKCIAKTLKTLKHLEHKNTADVNGVTITILKSILMFLSCPMVKNGGWSLVSKMMISRSSTGVINELGCVDFALNSKGLDVQMVQKRLQNLDACIEGIEEGLERLFRQLVQCRVKLLNILTDF